MCFSVTILGIVLANTNNVLLYNVNVQQPTQNNIPLELAVLLKSGAGGEMQEMQAVESVLSDPSSHSTLDAHQDT